MRKSLTDKIKMGAIGLGLAGILGLNSGCGTAFMLAAPYEKDPKNANALYTLGNAINEQENAETIANAIGKQPQNNNTPQREKESENFVFAFTGVEDDNPKDGYYQLNEFKGLKKTLWEVRGEPVGFCIYNTSKRGDLRFVLKKVEQGKEIVIRDETDRDAGKGCYRIRDPPYGLNNGEYVAEWSIDEVLVGKTRIKIEVKK